MAYIIKQTFTDRKISSNVYLKLENLQPSGSFKSRGIGHFMVEKLKAVRAQPNAASASAHFYCSSGGNAGLACVHAAVTLGCQATVVVPLSTTDFMIGKLRDAGATDVIQIGASWQEADDHLTGSLMPEAQAHGETPIYVPPFDAQGIWDGNSGITREILRQIGQTVNHYPVTSPATDGVEDTDTMPNVDAIVCSVGGGGLFSGVMQGVEEFGIQHRTRVIAVETEGADSLSQAVQKMEHITLPGITSLATSLGARRVCKQAFEYGLRDNVSTVVLSDADAIRACRRFADEERYVVELACGVCPALIYTGQLKDYIPGFNENSSVVIVVCGGSNMSYDIMDKYMAGLQ